MTLCILRAHFRRVLSDTQIPNSDSSLGVKVLTRHVNVICIFIFILILAVVLSLLLIKNFKAEMLDFQILKSQLEQTLTVWSSFPEANSS